MIKIVLEFKLPLKIHMLVYRSVILAYRCEKNWVHRMHSFFLISGCHFWFFTKEHQCLFYRVVQGLKFLITHPDQNLDQNLLFFIWEEKCMPSLWYLIHKYPSALCSSCVLEADSSVCHPSCCGWGEEIGCGTEKA